MIKIFTIIGHEVAIKNFNEDIEDSIIDRINQSILDSIFNGSFKINNNEIEFKVLEDNEYYIDMINNTLTSLNKILSEKLKNNDLEVCIIQTSEYYEDENDEMELFEDLKYLNKPMYEAMICDKNEEQLEDYITGRYCELSAVLDELNEFIDEINE